MNNKNDNFDSDSYVKVNTRLQEFWTKFPEGRLETEAKVIEGVLIMTARLFRGPTDTLPASTGHAFLTHMEGEKVGEFSETVAVGRALALMGFRVEKSIASSEEMDRFNSRPKFKKVEEMTSEEDSEEKDVAPPETSLKPSRFFKGTTSRFQSGSKS